MSSRSRSRSLRGLWLVGLMLLSACGGSEISEPSPDGIAGSPNDPCRLLSQPDAARILNRGDVRPGASVSADECSFTSEDGRAFLSYSVESRKLFELAAGAARSANAIVEPVAGVGDEAFFYTPRSSVGTGSVAITSLKARRRDRYFTTLVGNDQRYDREMEKQLALRLLSGP